MNSSTVALSVDYSENYWRWSAELTMLDNLDHNQELLKKAVHQQHTLMMSTTTSINELHSKTKERMDVITHKLNNVISEVNKMFTWFEEVDANKVGLQILAAYQLSIDILNEMEAKYIKLTAANTRTFLEFITPGHLHAVIKTVSAKLPTNLCIVERPSSRIEVKHNGTHITVSGFLHIMESSAYDLIKITPVPYRINKNEYAVAEVSSSFLAVDYNNQQYFEVSDTELGACNLLKKYTFLCNQGVVSQIGINDNCVIDHLYRRKTTNVCPLRKICISNITWKHLYRKNTWLFVANTPSEAAVICEGQREEISLEGVGILQLNQSCLIRTRENTLMAERNPKIEVQMTFIKPLNFTLSDTANTFSSRFTPKESILSTVDTWEKLSDVDDNRKEMFTYWRTIAHHSTVVGTPIIAILLGIAVWRCTRKCRRNKVKTKPTETRAEFMLEPDDDVPSPAVRISIPSNSNATEGAGRMSTE